VPITTLRVENFKCFLDSGTIDIAPLTVIFGRNNVGKSTLIQSLLLLRQTLDAASSEPRLNLRGPLLSAGSFADLVHEHRTGRNVTITLGVEPRSGGARTVALEYSADEPRQPRLVSLTVSDAGAPFLEIKRGRGAGGPYELHIDGERLGNEQESNFYFPVHGLLPAVGPEPPRIGRPSERRQVARVRARETLQDLESHLEHLRALGPFRTPPQRRYEYQGYDRASIDSEGKNVVDALIDAVARRGGSQSQLVREVNKWLRRVGDVQLMPIRRVARTQRLYELRLRNLKSGRWANFADVGSGIGQAFPVIVEGLRTPRGGLFLVQEPEIHLHPDAQLAMGDLLLSLARDGRRVIAETHSENVLLRIRRRAVEGKLDHSAVRILHVGVDADGNSAVAQLKMDELGQIAEWPAGFMEDATQERVALLSEMVANE
jgi:predicted ATPase